MFSKKKNRTKQINKPAPADSEGMEQLNTGWSPQQLSDGRNTYEAAGPLAPLIDATVKYIASLLPYLAVKSVALKQTEGLHGAPSVMLSVEYLQEDVLHHAARTIQLDLIRQLMINANIAKVEIRPDEKFIERFKVIWDGEFEEIFDALGD